MIVIETYNKFEYAPEGWTTTRHLLKQIKSSGKTILSLGNKYMNEGSQLVKEYRDKSGQVRMHFHADIIPQLKTDCDNIFYNIQCKVGRIREYSVEAIMNVLGKNEVIENQKTFDLLEGFSVRPDWIRNSDSKMRYMIMEMKSSLNQREIKAKVLKKYPLILNSEKEKSGYLFVIGINGERMLRKNLDKVEKEIFQEHGLQIKIKFYKLENLLKRIYRRENKKSFFTKILSDKYTSIDSDQIKTIKLIHEFLNRLNDFSKDLDVIVNKNYDSSMKVDEIQDVLIKMLNDKSANYESAYEKCLEVLD